ncbi:MAG: hypothetical protein LZF61_03590 [Nitrosomonas sp.]|nr:MAG: hypothetical protein LZF61_03590 [Nitrosomonas sp.]
MNNAFNNTLQDIAANIRALAPGDQTQQQDLAVIKNDIGELKTDNAKQNSQIAGITTMLGSIQTSIDQLKRAIDQHQVCEAADKEAICVFLTEIDALVRGFKGNSPDDFNKSIISYKNIPEANRCMSLLKDCPEWYECILELLNPYPEGCEKSLKEYLRDVARKIEELKKKIECATAK